MRVLVIHQPVPPQATQDNQDVLVQASAVADALTRLGHEVVIHPGGESPAELVQLLYRERPDAVFNLVEAFFGKDFFQWLAAGILTELKIPFTGNDEDALFLTGDKLIAKSILNEAGLPTPEWIVPHEIARDWLESWERMCLAGKSPEQHAPLQSVDWRKSLSTYPAASRGQVAACYQTLRLRSRYWFTSRILVQKWLVTCLGRFGRKTLPNSHA
jgi:carbamoylphosphate synthase large subunit